MSDFIERLAQRSLGQPMNLRPRRMPAFEDHTSVDEPLARKPVEPRASAAEKREPSLPKGQPAAESNAEPPASKSAEKVSENSDSTGRTVTHHTNHTIHERENRHTERLESVRTESIRSEFQSQTTLINQVLEHLPSTKLPTGVLRSSPPKVSIPAPNLKGGPPEIEEKAPDVEIHIGRIEVRAQFAPAIKLPEPPKQKAPAVSLESYLEGRR